ncbi:MAG TPA: hypothetical protein VGD95_08145 [Micavibrio sp.]
MTTHAGLTSRPRPLPADAATIAPLSRREKQPDQGDKRRKQVAAVLGAAGGVGAVLAVKSAATAMALWAGAPALVVAGAGLASVMAVSGSMNYFKQRAALKASGQPVPDFRFKDLARSMFTSKASLMAGGMTALAAALPGALLMAASASVAALGAGLYEYKSRRDQDRARGIDVGPASLRDAFKTVFKSKSAGKAFLISVGIGSILSIVTGTSWSPAEHGANVDVARADAPQSPSVAPAASPDYAAMTPSAAPDAPMPEMAAAPAAPAAPAPIPVVDAPVIAAEPAAEAPVADVAAVPTPDDAGLSDNEELVDTAPAETLSAEMTPMDPADIAMPAADEVIFENTGPDGVHQILYGSGIIETIYPAEAVDVPAADVMAEDVPAPDTPAPDTPVEPAPVESAPLQETPVQETPVQEAPVSVAPVSEAASSRTIIHESGIRETITPIYADAAQAPAVEAAPAAEAPVSQTVGECLISETDSEIRVDCKLDVNAEMKPGSSIDFRAAANPDQILQAVVPEGAAPISAGEFLEDKALPGAHAAYEKGYFKPVLR